MRIKTFQGRSLEELLPKIKQELGEGAVVLGQRPKVVGGIGGFFGTRMIEVTASDRMPSDSQLIDMDDDLARDSQPNPDQQGDGEELAERFRTAMSMGRRGGIDVTDDWNPAEDEELAQEYGRVLEHAASSGFTELDVPVVAAQAPTQQASPAAASAPAPAPAAPVVSPDPQLQAQRLVDRTHEQVQARADRVDAQYNLGTYAQPAAAMPTNPTAATRPVQSFQAEVVDAAPRLAAEELLMSDLSTAANPMPQPVISDAVSNAMDLVDLRAIAALRNAVEASRRIEDGWKADITPDLAAVLADLEHVGVDDEVAASIASTVIRHRQPFAPSASNKQLAREVVEETLDVRSGFHRTPGRAHRFALVGASSSGKTTVLAKLATAYAKSGMRVGIVVLLPDDPTNAVMQDPRLASLNVDVRYVTNIAQAQAAADTFDDYELMLIDTPGASYYDAALRAHIDSCLRVLGSDDVHVVVPLGTSSREAASLVDTYLPLGANRLIVSRVDESRYIGQVLNFGFRLGLPMTFLSDGPDVSSGIKAASTREIADRIVPSTTRTVVGNSEENGF